MINIECKQKPNNCINLDGGVGIVIVSSRDYKVIYMQIN